MASRFLIPTAVAAAVHALIFVGEPSTSVAGRAGSPKTAEPVPPTVPVVIDPPEEIFVKSSEDTPPKGNPDVLRPPSPEAPPVISPYVQEPAEWVPTATTVIERIVPGRYGVPEGDDDVRSNRPVINARLLDNQPRIRNRVPPAYPPAARAAGLTGQVVVEFIVDENGRVLRMSVIESSDPVFEESTLRAVGQWRFTPGRKDGQPVRFRMVVPVTFNLAT